jgi:hypothetical protein
MVDMARAPVYIWGSGSKLMQLWVPIGIATIGVLVGTLMGERILFGLSPARFGRVLGAAIGALGLWLLLQ